mmetsp:Transcript_46025/g.139712  ORF Transcript_46025/g.139712 Transcript_46025/m.139712 type:complete len:94 (-) Transcript_46025:215-496(-)
MPQKAVTQAKPQQQAPQRAKQSIQALQSKVEKILGCHVPSFRFSRPLLRPNFAQLAVCNESNYITQAESRKTPGAPFSGQRARILLRCMQRPQ